MRGAVHDPAGQRLRPRGGGVAGAVQVVDLIRAVDAHIQVCLNDRLLRAGDDPRPHEARLVAIRRARREAQPGG